MVRIRAFCESRSRGTTFVQVTVDEGDKRAWMFEQSSTPAAPAPVFACCPKGPGPERPPSRSRVGEALGEWQAAEVAGAWRYPQCRGLSRAQLEDLYQETVLALLNRPFASEEHLRNALRVGLRNRALHVHRDERRRGEILSAHAPEAHRSALRRSEIEQPEQAALAREDGLIVLEFASGLTELEQQVYALEAEGLRYRAIAPILGVGTNQARKASRELAEKYARFQLLHDTGRLCGYRAPTIRALLAGEETSASSSPEAPSRTCAPARSAAPSTGRMPRACDAASRSGPPRYLPLPALLGHDRAHGLWLRARLLLHRLAASGAPTGGGGARERALALMAGGAAHREGRSRRRDGRRRRRWDAQRQRRPAQPHPSRSPPPCAHGSHKHEYTCLRARCGGGAVQPERRNGACERARSAGAQAQHATRTGRVRVPRRPRPGRQRCESQCREHAGGYG